MLKSNSTHSIKANLFWLFVFIACIASPMVADLFGMACAAVLFVLSVRRSNAKEEEK